MTQHTDVGDEVQAVEATGENDSSTATYIDWIDGDQPKQTHFVGSAAAAIHRIEHELGRQLKLDQIVRIVQNGVEATYTSRRGSLGAAHTMAKRANREQPANATKLRKKKKASTRKPKAQKSHKLGQTGLSIPSTPAEKQPVFMITCLGQRCEMPAADLETALRALRVAMPSAGPGDITQIIRVNVDGSMQVIPANDAAVDAAFETMKPTEGTYHLVTVIVNYSDNVIRQFTFFDATVESTITTLLQKLGPDGANILLITTQADQNAQQIALSARDFNKMMDKLYK